METSIQGTHESEDGRTITYTGTITGGCSSKVFIGGQATAYVGSTTTEYDSECIKGTGEIASGSSKVFIQGNAAARIGDTVQGHQGTGTITSGSGNVTFG